MDSGTDVEDRILRAELRALLGGLPDGGDLEADAAGEGLGGGRGPGQCSAGAPGDGVLRPRAMPAVGHGDRLHRLPGVVSRVAQGDLPAGSGGTGRGRQQEAAEAAARRSQPMRGMRSVRVRLPATGASSGVCDQHRREPVGGQPDFVDQKKGKGTVINGAILRGS